MSLWSADARVSDAQDLEDLATASWLAETLFAALELDLFRHLGEEDRSVPELARLCAADMAATERLVAALQVLGLVSIHQGRVAATTVTRRHLLPGGPAYLGHSLAYRRRLSQVWTGLADAVRAGGSQVRPPVDETEEAYRGRVRDYLLAMDDVARHKARLIAERLDLEGLPPTVLDVAGGAGGIAAAVVAWAAGRGWQGLVVDLPDVVREARTLWAERAARGEGDGPAFRPLDLLAEPLPAPAPGGAAEAASGWGLVVCSNIVHAYAEAEAAAILRAAADALDRRGLLVVHDFWTDSPGRGPAKSALFDLHMLANTYQGRTYPWTWARDILREHGLIAPDLVPLGERPGDEDTGLVVAAWDPAVLKHVRQGPLEWVDAVARELGFHRTAPLAPDAVVTEAWVGEKCRFGCSGYGKGGQCPPRSPAVADTRAVLASYSEALLVEGEPPGGDFHRSMLALERAAFLAGNHRALAFVAGPCRLCTTCTPDRCSQPRSARPAMEAAGIDVYETAASVGWDLRPVTQADDPVAYLGLLLVR